MLVLVEVAEYARLPRQEREAGAMPVAAHALFDRRLRQLPDEVLTTLRAAAVIGDVFELDVTVPGGTDAEASIELEGDCIHSAELQPGGDPGRFSIEPGKITAWKSQEKDSCNVAVRVVQTRHGQADPALGADSSVVLRQIRATRFVSAP